MSKIIIKHESNLDDVSAVYYAMKVIQRGRIGGKCYCYATEFASGVCVYASRTETGTDVFEVSKKL